MSDLGLTPGLAPGLFVKAKAAAREPFHSQADALVAHYAPQIASALGSLFTTKAVKAAIKAAESARAEKSAPPPPPNLRTGTARRNCGTCQMFFDGRCWGYGDFPVLIDQLCDNWSPELAKETGSDPIADAARAALGDASAKELGDVLLELYGDAGLLGTHDAAHAAGATVVTSLGGVTEAVDKDYWDKWTPGHGEAAAKVADGGLKDLLDEADITIKGLVDTSIERIGNSIADSLAKGDSPDTAAKAVAEVVEDTSRSESIANTEYARAMTASSMDTYKEAGVKELEWMAEGDACPECEENEAASPLPTGDEWPNGDVPVHTNCRCAIAPVVEVPDDEPATDTESE